MGIEVHARANREAEVLVYDQIGADWFGDGLTAKKFRADIEKLGEVDTITVRINSPGGAVFDGMAIFNTLKEHKAKKIVRVDGLAASIASVIAMVGDERHMGAGTQLMIHDPWTGVVGNAKALRETADTLDSIKSGMTDIYESSGLPRDQIESIMANETWLTATEAKELGFVTHIAGDEAKALKAESQQVFAHFRNVPNALKVSPIMANFQSEPSDANKQKEPSMSNVPNASGDTGLDVNKVQAEAREAEFARQKGIREAFGKFSFDHLALMTQCLDDPKCDTAQASQKLLAAISAGAAPVAVIKSGMDERDNFIQGATAAIMARVSGTRDGANKYNGMGLQALIRESLTRQGEVNAHRMDGRTLWAKFNAAHSTSDFPLLLSNTAGKILKKEYEEAPVTWQKIAVAGEVSDFKAVKRLSLSSFPLLTDKLEGEEYDAATVSENAESIQASTKGRFIKLTREMVINDDLGAFLRVAKMMGRSAARSVNKSVYGVLGANAALSDSVALFHATHGNLAGSGAAITVASIAAAEAAMAAQKDKQDTVLNLRPAILLAPRGKRQIAWDVLNSPTDISQSNSAKRNYAASLGLELVDDAELDAISTTAWYLFADPNSAPMLEVAFLDGQQTPFIDEDIDFMTDSMRMKVRLDWGVAATDFRPGYKNPGA